MGFNPNGIKDGGPKDPIWIGISTNVLGAVFMGGGQMAVDFGVDLSHGDGNGGLTEPQRNLYIHILRAAAMRLEQGSKNVLQSGQFNIQKVGQG